MMIHIGSGTSILF